MRKLFKAIEIDKKIETYVALDLYNFILLEETNLN